MNLHTEPFSLTMCSQILGDISFSGSSRGNKLSRLSFIFCEHSFGCSERSLTRRRCFHDIIPVSSVEDRHFVTLLACFVPTIITWYIIHKTDQYLNTWQHMQNLLGYSCIPYSRWNGGFFVSQFNTKIELLCIHPL